MNQPWTQDVFDRVTLRAVTTATGEHPSLLHLSWLAPRQGERVVQVYLDGTLYDVTSDAQQREMWLICDRASLRRVELLAVDVHDADAVTTPHPQALQGWQPALIADHRWRVLRDANWPADTFIELSVDGERTRACPLWSDRDERSGFGAIFGAGAFGFDDAAMPGLGLGELGVGPLGMDGRALSLLIDVDTGEHDVQFVAVDRAGQAISEPFTLPAGSLDSPPEPARKFLINSDFTLTWTT